MSNRFWTGRRLAMVLALLATASLARPLLAATPARVVEYYHVDALGSVRAVTDAAGAVIERHDYLPYGEEWCTTPTPGLCGSVPPGQPQRFTGKERDAETGLDYFGARYYGSKIGRFTTVDPVYTWQDNLVDPQRWNRYAYAKSNPLRYVDPDGRAVWEWVVQQMIVDKQFRRDVVNAEINLLVRLWNNTLGNKGHVKPEVQAALDAQTAPATTQEAVIQAVGELGMLTMPLLPKDGSRVIALSRFGQHKEAAETFARARGAQLLDSPPPPGFTLENWLRYRIDRAEKVFVRMEDVKPGCLTWDCEVSHIFGSAENTGKTTFVER